MAMPRPSPETSLHEEAADWAITLQYGVPSDAERAEFARWLAQGPQQQAAWDRAQNLFRSLDGFPQGTAASALRQPARTPDRRRVLGLMAAATVASAATAAGWHHQPWQKWTADAATGVGEQKTLALPDATQLVLNTDSAVDIAFHGAQRRVDLVMGEILVTARSEPRPFLVGTPLGEVRSQGARFSLRRMKDDLVRVSVFRESVEIRPANGTAQRLHAGESADFDCDGVHMAMPVDDSDTVWEKGMLLAQDRRLVDVLAEMSRYRSGVLRCDPEVADIRVSGAISLVDTDSGLDLLARTLPVRVQRRTPWWVTVTARG